MVSSGVTHTPSPERMRLQKFLSDAGVASRRHAEELVRAGRVLINDLLVTELPAFVEPGRDRVTVDGAVVRMRAPEYFLVHKPKGVVCTNRDPAGRIRAADLLPPTKAKLNVVGRLDVESSGLLLMTNDGELADRITHPRLEIPKVYLVEVRGQAPREIVPQLLKGVHLSEGKATASAVEIVKRSRESSLLKITLREGRNRQVRRMLARLKFPVKSLKRIQIGPLSLKGLPVGACRRLTPHELSQLREALRSAQLRTSRSRPFRRSKHGHPVPDEPRPAGAQSGKNPSKIRADDPSRAEKRTPGRRRLIT